VFEVAFCDPLQKQFSLSLLSADIHFTRRVPSYSVDVGSSWRFRLFLFEHAKQTVPPHQKHKQIEEKYFAFVLSGKWRHVTKYRNIDVCCTANVPSVE
jgi:hypothetical protein